MGSHLKMNQNFKKIPQHQQEFPFLKTDLKMVLDPSFCTPTFYHTTLLPNLKRLIFRDRCLPILALFKKRIIGLIYCRPFQATPPTFTTFWAWWRVWVVFPLRLPPSRLRGSTTTKATTPKRRGRRQNTPSTYHHLHPHLQHHAAALQPRNHPYWMTLANQH